MTFGCVSGCVRVLAAHHWMQLCLLRRLAVSVDAWPPLLPLLSCSCSYQFGVPQAKELISKCFDHGVNL